MKSLLPSNIRSELHNIHNKIGKETKPTWITPNSHTINIFSKMYQEIVGAFACAPIPNILKNESIIMKQSNYMYIPDEIRDSIGPIKLDASKKMVVPPFLCKIPLPRNRRVIHVAIWGANNKREAIICSYKIGQWFTYLDKHLKFSPSCSQDLTIFLFLTNKTKKFKGAGAGTFPQELDRSSVNSAFTYGCIPSNEIYVFRKEEWFKVLIHESFHSLGIDFSNLNNQEDITKRIIETTFHGIECEDLRLYEAYTEFWAEIYNTLISIYEKTGRKEFDAIVQKKVDLSIKMELIWSLVQCNKVLSHYQISYQDLFTKKMKKYREKETQVFSYYILKSILYVYYQAFMKWSCSSMQDSVIECVVFDQKKMSKFLQFIHTSSTNSFYRTILGFVELHMGPLLRNHKSLAMSLWGKYMIL